METKSFFDKIYSVISKVFISGCIIYLGVVFVLPLLSSYFADSHIAKEEKDSREFQNKFKQEHEERQQEIADLYWGKKVSDKKCPVHNKTLRPDIVRIAYGLPKILRKEKDFPYSNLKILGGCEVKEKKLEYVLYCSACRNAEKQWMKKQKFAKADP